MNLANCIATAEKIAPETYSASQLIPLIDFTNLNEQATATEIEQLCAQSVTPFGKVAGVCIYQQFLPLVTERLAQTGIPIVTVANFPEGHADLNTTLQQIDAGLTQGAQEIDIVIPYQKFLAGDTQYVSNFLTACRAACPSPYILKVILEIGALNTHEAITACSQLAIQAGVDFIKTSTGKQYTGATLEGAASMLSAIKDSQTMTGFKASGGIRTQQQASSYLKLAELIVGADWINPRTFRLGTSTLVSALCMERSSHSNFEY
jgi:deoxyribose-phosphate aldolase